MYFHHDHLSYGQSTNNFVTFGSYKAEGRVVGQKGFPKLSFLHDKG